MKHIHIVAAQHLDVAWLWTRVPQGEDLMRQCFERYLALFEQVREMCCERQHRALRR